MPVKVIQPVFPQQGRRYVLLIRALDALLSSMPQSPETLRVRLIRGGPGPSYWLFEDIEAVLGDMAAGGLAVKIEGQGWISAESRVNESRVRETSQQRERLGTRESGHETRDGFTWQSEMFGRDARSA